MIKFKIALIDGHYNQEFYSSALKLLDAEIINNATQSEIEKNPDIDICITIGEAEAKRALAIKSAISRHIPTLMVMDGIIEWRNTWEHFDDPKNKLTMPLHQPVLSHKIACYGFQQARIFEAFGNRGKPEIVGSPRFDYLLHNNQRLIQSKDDNEFKILVATAKTPYFSKKQQKLVIKSLIDLKKWVNNNPVINQRKIILVWRLSHELHNSINVQMLSSTKPIKQILQSVDAVITTPSTVIIESMLLKKPVALLDYTNSPQYLVPAWTINTHEHLDWWVPELISPPPAKLFHQQMVLNDTLYIDKNNSASKRLAELITAMVLAGRIAREKKSPLFFPKKILPVASNSSYQSFSLLDLHPNIDAFKQDNIINLQVELGHLRDENEKLLASSLLWSRYKRFGYGSLLSRLIHCFPFPRRMIRAIKYWYEDINIE